MKQPIGWPIVRLGSLLLVISGLGVPSSAAWAQSLEVADRDKTQAEVIRRVDQLVHETAQEDPELAREIQRQKDRVLHEMKDGRLDDARLVREIETYRGVQRELVHRVAQAHVEDRIAEVAARHPELAHQLGTAFEAWRNGNGKETFAQFERGFDRGENIRHLSREGVERVQRETERFVAEHPEKAGYARAFLQREIEQARPEARERAQLTAPDRVPQVIERARTQEPAAGAAKEAPNTKTRGVEPAKEVADRAVTRTSEVATHEKEQVRAAPAREVERAREAPTRGVERAREAPAREGERIREAPARQVERVREPERVREAPRVERTVERPTPPTKESVSDARGAHRQKNSQKH